VLIDLVDDLRSTVIAAIPSLELKPFLLAEGHYMI